ncbi:hypothetical protein Tco_1505803 [Tanacetum coccineum]
MATSVTRRQRDADYGTHQYGLKIFVPKTRCGKSRCHVEIARDCLHSNAESVAFTSLRWSKEGKLTNLNVEEHLAFGMFTSECFTRSVSSGSANKDKKNRLMRINELHKFSDSTINDVWSALDDILKRIRMEYFPKTVWRNIDREKAGAMIQAIDR